MIKIYTRYNCPQCKLSKRLLDSLKKDYEVVNTDDNPEYLDMLKKEGYKQLPVFELNGERLFSGFRPSDIKNKL